MNFEFMASQSFKTRLVTLFNDKRKKSLSFQLIHFLFSSMLWLNSTQKNTLHCDFTLSFDHIKLRIKVYVLEFIFAPDNLVVLVGGIRRFGLTSKRVHIAFQSIAG